jgi:hypothetical protein
MRIVFILSARLSFQGILKNQLFDDLCQLTAMTQSNIASGKNWASFETSPLVNAMASHIP